MAVKSNTDGTTSWWRNPEWLLPRLLLGLLLLTGVGLLVQLLAPKPWIKLETLLLILLSGWVISAIGYLLLVIFTQRHREELAAVRLHSSKNKPEHLSLERTALLQASSYDPLTGAFNRAGLDRAYALEGLPCFARHQEVSLLLMDMDHFKSINNSHGRSVGDQVLRRFAEMVRDVLRVGDSFSRWGGQEFLVLCPRTSSAQARVVAEKIRSALHAAQWPLNLKVTVSIGVASVKQSRGLEAAVRSADAALVRAKQSGRDRIEM